MCERGTPITGLPKEAEVMTRFEKEERMSMCLHQEQIYIQNSPTCMQVVTHGEDCMKDMVCYHKLNSYENLADDLEDLFENGHENAYQHEVIISFYL